MVSKSEEELRAYCECLLRASGMTPGNAEMAADVYVRATLRGVGHHDISELASRARKVRNHEMVANPSFQKLTGFHAMESYDGGNGMGELCCAMGMRRAMELADQYGIGLAAMRNTNHFLAGAPYTEMAAERGYIGLILAKGGVSMGITGANKCMSALPMSFAYPVREEYPVLLDACMAYASFGQLAQRAERGQKVKPWWGCDAQGKPTEDPAEMARGIRYPIGEYKGFGLAMLGEVLTAVLSGAGVLDQVQNFGGDHALDQTQSHGSDRIPNRTQTHEAHTVIAIKADALVSKEEFLDRAQFLSDRARQLSGCDLHIPGDGSRKAVGRSRETNCIFLSEQVVNDLKKLEKEWNLEMRL